MQKWHFTLSSINSECNAYWIEIRKKKLNQRPMFKKFNHWLWNKSSTQLSMWRNCWFFNLLTLAKKKLFLYSERKSSVEFFQKNNELLYGHCKDYTNETFSVESPGVNSQTGQLKFDFPQFTLFLIIFFLNNSVWFTFGFRHFRLILKCDLNYNYMVSSKFQRQNKNKRECFKPMNSIDSCFIIPISCIISVAAATLFFIHFFSLCLHLHIWLPSLF